LSKIPNSAIYQEFFTSCEIEIERDLGLEKWFLKKKYEMAFWHLNFLLVVEGVMRNKGCK